MRIQHVYRIPSKWFNFSVLNNAVTYIGNNYHNIIFLRSVNSQYYNIYNYNPIIFYKYNL